LNSLTIRQSQVGIGLIRLDTAIPYPTSRAVHPLARLGPEQAAKTMTIHLAAEAEPIPGYTLIAPLGRGGFGEVWKAQAPGGIPKAIKFVKGSLDDIAEGRVAACQELKSLNRVKEVRHPFILGLERVDIIDGQLIIVMELADKDLSKRLEECRAQGKTGIPRAELLRYMDETAEALDLMNGEYQLQHLDIKPQNLFLVCNHVKVADFGLVKDLEGMTATITAGITPIYASPETFEGKASRTSDQYSLAIVYQELLTGARPYVGKNARQLLMEHMKGVPNLEPLPPADRAIVARALSKVPGDRFPNCAEFINQLRKAAVGGVSVAVAAGRAAEVSRPAPEPAAPAEPPRWSRATSADFSLFDSGERKAPPKPARPPKKVDDTVSITPAAKSPTVKIEPAKKAKDAPKPAKEKPRVKAAPAPVRPTPCPECGVTMIDPGPFAWCGNCGHCSEVEQQNTLRKHDLAINGAHWRVVLLGGLAVAGALVLAEGMASGAKGIWGMTALLLGLAAFGFGTLGMYISWPGRTKRKRKKTTMVRRQLPPP